jgi:hypothetical protein
VQKRKSDEICARLGFDAARVGSLLSAFRDNLSVPSSRVKQPKKNYVVVAKRRQPTTNIYAAKNPRSAQIALIRWWKREMAE